MILYSSQVISKVRELLSTTRRKLNLRVCLWVLSLIKDPYLVNTNVVRLNMRQEGNLPNYLISLTPICLWSIKTKARINKTLSFKSINRTKVCSKTCQVQDSPNHKTLSTDIESKNHINSTSAVGRETDSTSTTHQMCVIKAARFAMPSKPAEHRKTRLSTNSTKR